MKHLASTILILLTASGLRSQSIRDFVDEFKIYSGFNVIGFYNTNTFDDFKIINPDVLNYPLDVNSYPNKGVMYDFYDFYGFPYLNFYLNAGIGHQLKNPNLTWGIALNYSYSTTDLHYYNNSGYRYYDQQLNASNAVVSYKDSSLGIYLNYGMLSKKTAIENSITFRTNDHKRWTFVFGFSGQVGVLRPVYSFDYEAEFAHHQYDSLGNRTTIDSTITKLNMNYAGEINPYASFNGVFGFDVKLSRKENFLKNTHLFSEFKPGMCIHYIPEVGKIRSTWNGMFSLVGLRFTLNP